MMLEVQNLQARYGRALILQGLDFSMAQGEVLALIGRNGAGKSTTMKAIIGLLKPTEGRISFAGRDVAGLPAFEIARLGIGYVPEERRIFTDLTVLENLEVGRQPARGERKAWTAEELFALFPNLAVMRNRLGGQMSGGEQQMLSIARTLMGNPSLVLLDEPSEGLSPLIVQQMAGAVRALKAQGVSILLAEQNQRFAEGVADRAVILQTGRIVWQGAMAAMASEGAAHLSL